MSTIQNLKNFIRHGKQARAADGPRDQPTTNVSPVHASPQKYHQGHTEPLGVHPRQLQQDVQPQPGQYSVAAGDNRNIAAQAGGAAAHAAGKNQKVHHSHIEAIVAEEREKANKMPKYPGLERFILVEKMGDGAFSNVYKARDTQTGDEVAIKVVRKFEMNSNQVCLDYVLEIPLTALPLPFPFYTLAASPFLSHLHPSLVFESVPEPTSSNIGRRSHASELQEATKGRRGAHIYFLPNPFQFPSFGITNHSIS